MSTKTSINEQELEKFDLLSKQWWQEDGEFKILHTINPIRLSYIIEKIKSHFNISDDTSSNLELDILDVGCGGGLVSSRLCQNLQNMQIPNFAITGIDALRSNIEIATSYAKAQNLPIQYLQSTAEELVASNYPPADVVLCLEVIEHVENVPDFIQNLSLLVKPNGMIIISTINRTYKAYILAILMAECVLGWIKRGTHDYNKFLKPSEIYAMFKNNNIELKELKGLSFNIINNNWQLDDNIDINYFAYLKPIKIL